MAIARLGRPDCEPWLNWRPVDRATLCFVVSGEEILLIHKKRGLGAGKINGPGGRLELNELPVQAAIRESQEELGITPVDPQLRGTLHFQFADGYSLECSVFIAASCTGEAIETEEAIPMWTPVSDIPFDRMWADDAHWMPGLLAGRSFNGFFEFDGDEMRSKVVFWSLSDDQFGSLR